MKKVNILLSSYNGEKYIREQLESLLKQSYSNMQIYVRDDGSTDGTIGILQEYEAKKDIIVIRGDNVNWHQSFMILLEEITDGDYWAFCDQDDIWLPDKIQRAVEWLNAQNEELPLLFSSLYEFRDESMQNSNGIYQLPSIQIDFPRILTNCIYAGFSMVINRPMRELALRARRQNLNSHDWWINILAIKFGKTYMDTKVTVYYRRLDTSVTAYSLKSRVKWFVDAFRNTNTITSNCAKEFVRIFRDELRDEDIKVAQWFAKRGFGNSIKKAFWRKRWRPNLTSELSIRLLMLCGRI